MKKDHVDSECGFALAHVICRPIWPECKSGNLTFFQYVVRVVIDLPDLYNSIMLTRINSIVVETRLLVVRLLYLVRFLFFISRYLLLKKIDTKTNICTLHGWQLLVIDMMGIASICLSNTIMFQGYNRQRVVKRIWKWIGFVHYFGQSSKNRNVLCR